METNCHTNRERFEFQQIFRRRVIKLRSFCIHAFIYVIALNVFILKEYFGFNFDFLPIGNLSYAMIIWICVFFFSAIDLVLSYTIFGREWEERKLKSILEKRQQKQKWV